MENPLNQYTEAQRYIEAMSAPYHEAQVSDDEQCTEISKVVIQSLLILHGGGLLAVATFTGSKPLLLGGRIVVVILAFGLFLTLLATYQAFLALSHRSHANGARVEAVSQRARAQVFELEHTRTKDAAFKDEADRATAEADRIAPTIQYHLDAYVRYHHETVDLLLLSAFVLVTAAWVGALVMR